MQVQRRAAKLTFKTENSYDSRLKKKCLPLGNGRLFASVTFLFEALISIGAIAARPFVDLYADTEIDPVASNVEPSC